VASQGPLFAGIPREFHSFSMHYDEVCELPRGTELLASSELCRIQAFAVHDAPAFGVQFHPERDLTGAGQTFAAKRKLRPQPPLLHPARDDLYNPLIAATLVRNFYGLVQGGGR
jgi:GMP synthase-like glutamine amidotransferase